MTRALRSLVLIVLIAGCQGIVGIEDHVFEAGVVTSAACVDYCNVVMSACQTPNAVYSSQATCLGVCALLLPGSPNEAADDNTIACRKRYAVLAKNSEPSFNCPRAGPGGGGTCGSNCASYCTLIKKACPDQGALLTDCENQCAAFRTVGTFDVVANHEGDTLECRLVHVSSATVEPATHCSHTGVFPTAFCVDDPTAAPDCNNFCRLELAACTGDLTVYESSTQCKAVCAALPPGTNGDTSQNTVGCRQYHSYNAVLNPSDHCPHTGPGGDAHCGADVMDDDGNCHSYCILLQQACGTDFVLAFPTGQAACQKDCTSKLDALGAKRDSRYKVSAGLIAGNTMSCRLLHVSRALSDATECPSALGGGVCAP